MYISFVGTTAHVLEQMGCVMLVCYQSLYPLYYCTLATYMSKKLPILQMKVREISLVWAILSDIWFLDKMSTFTSSVILLLA